MFLKTIVSNYSQFEILYVGTFLVTYTAYWIPSLLFALVDYFKPPVFYKHKIQTTLPSWTLIFKSLLLILYNQMFAIPFLVILLSPLLNRRIVVSSTLPSWGEMGIHFIGFLIVAETGFYYMHRLAHHPRLYKHGHKIHHEWKAPYAFMSQYCHPLEEIAVNALPCFLGPIFMGAHFVTMWLWLLVANVVAVNAHCGYQFTDCLFHDFHHENPKTNFGILGILDWFHGTDDLFYDKIGGQSKWGNLFLNRITQGGCRELEINLEINSTLEGRRHTIPMQPSGV
jgi:methylsterol monooxygenase